MNVKEVLLASEFGCHGFWMLRSFCSVEGSEGEVPCLRRKFEISRPVVCAAAACAQVRAPRCTCRGEAPAAAAGREGRAHAAPQQRVD